MTAMETERAAGEWDERPGGVDCGDEKTMLADSPSLRLDLVVADRDAVAELSAFPEGPERDEYALCALRVGLLALRLARGQIDADAVRREAQAMLATLDSKLSQHAQAVQTQVAGSLREYFDPENGRFNERLKRLVERDGDLERMLRSQVGTQDSELCKTLLAHVGEQSPLMKLLSPQESHGFLTYVRETLEKQLDGQRELLLTEFSLDNKQGALSRLIDELADRHGKLTEALRGKVDEVVKEFSLDEESSALSRLVRNVEGAQKKISQEFSLDEKNSAFSRLREMLSETTQAIHGNLTLDDKNSSLARLKEELFTLLGAQSEANQRFQEEVKLALGTMLARREEADRSTQHGLAFEDAVCEYFERAARQQGDLFARVGTQWGVIAHCKTGDLVIELGADNAAAGARIVVEAKEDASYTLGKAREELEKSRKNRDAQIGLFVFSSRSAPAATPELSRQGNDLFVVWNPHDATTDLHLKAALIVARALCVRARRASESQAADFEAITTAVLEIDRQAQSLGEISTWATTIANNGAKILERVRKSRESLERQVETLQRRLADLKQHVSAEPDLAPNAN